MKILRVIPSMDPSSGGPCQGIRNSIPALSKLGIVNEVVSLDDPTASFISKDPFRIYALGPCKSSWRYSKILFNWLLKNLINYDAVIVHALWLYHGYAVRKALEKLKKSGHLKLPKLFVMPHGMLDPYFQKARNRKLKALRNVIYWKSIESKLVHAADAVLFTCEEELLLARQPFHPYHPHKETNVGYGITEPPHITQKMFLAFSKRCPEITNKNYFLFLSRIHDKKGVDLIIKAYLQVFYNEKKVFSTAPMLVIAGPGLETDYGKEVKQLAVNSKAANSILFPGMLEGDAKWGAFQGCEAFILPSHQENFGIAIVEAMACSKPVIISDKVNIWREISNAGAGLVAPDTAEGTLQSMKEWSSLKGLEKLEMGKKARACYEQQFAIEPAARKLADTLQFSIS